MKHLLFAFVALFSFSFPAMSQPEKTIDDLFVKFDKTNLPSAAVMVIKDGKPVFAKLTDWPIVLAEAFVKDPATLRKLF